jgi:hypothetical protein
MAETLLVIQVVLAGLALGMGLYLLVRVRGEGTPVLPGLTLLAFALSVGFDALANYTSAPDTRFFMSLLSIVLVVLTLLLAIGVLVALQRRLMPSAWRYVSYGSALLVLLGTMGLLLSADIGVRIIAVIVAGTGVLLLGLTSSSAPVAAE